MGFYGGDPPASRCGFEIAAAGGQTLARGCSVATQHPIPGNSGKCLTLASRRRYAEWCVDLAGSGAGHPPCSRRFRGGRCLCAAVRSEEERDES